MPRPIVIIESPFAGRTVNEVNAHLDYLRRAQRDSWDRGENPFASHGYYPQFLNEGDPKERAAGIEAGYEMWRFAAKIVFYIDLGLSPGMKAAHERAMRDNCLVELRSIEKMP